MRFGCSIFVILPVRKIWWPIETVPLRFRKPEASNGRLNGSIETRTWQRSMMLSIILLIVFPG